MLLRSTAEEHCVSADVVAGVTLSPSLKIVLQRKLQIACDKMIVYHRFSSVEIRHLLLVVMPFNCSDQAEEKLSRISALERERLGRRPVYCKVAGCTRSFNCNCRFSLFL